MTHELSTLFFHNSECLDGNVTCFEDYIPDVEGRLNATQVNELRDLLLQLFFFDYNHQDSVLVDITDIHQYITHSKFDESIHHYSLQTTA